MAREIVEYEENCRGCQNCVSCGADKPYPVYKYECDICEEEFEPKDLRMYQSMELCPECLLREWLKSNSLRQIADKLLEYRFEEYLIDEFEKIEGE